MKPIIRLKEQEGGAFLGEIEMPLAGGGRIIVGALALGDDPEELGWGFSSLKSAARKIGSRAKALKKVAAIAKRVSQDPVVKALMPAQVNAAVKATSAIAKMAEQRGSKYKTREYTRCRRCGRARSVYRKFGVCRICLRELAHNGYIPGMTKSSW